MKNEKERYVGDVLSEMSSDALQAIMDICRCAVTKKKQSGYYQSALLIRDHLNDEQQMVAYYLIGTAEKERVIPLILNLYI